AESCQKLSKMRSMRQAQQPAMPIRSERRFNRQRPGIIPSDLSRLIMTAILQQRLLPLIRKRPGELFVHEIYRSLQGESAYAGLPCIFVRLAVCDSRCVCCDTPHAFSAGESRSLDRIVEEVLAYACPLVEVTGGEPLLQAEVVPLMTSLCDAGLKVLLETSGAHPIDPVDRRVHIVMDLKCPGSGEAERNRWENLSVLKASDEIKFVIASR